jgi:hypothetical protein
MKPFDRITFVGIITLLLWISYLPYLYPTPFQSHEGFQRFAKDAAELPEWLKEEGGIGGYSQSDVERALKTERIRYWFISLITYAVGILAGVLILRRKNSGRILVIGLSSFLLFLRAYNIITSPHPLERLSFLYSTFLKKYPVIVIHNDIIAVIILIGTIIYLLRPSIAGEFKTRTA